MVRAWVRSSRTVIASRSCAEESVVARSRGAGAGCACFLGLGAGRGSGCSVLPESCEARRSSISSTGRGITCWETSFTNPACCRRSGFHRCLHCCHLAHNLDGDKAVPDDLLADQTHVGGLQHDVGGFYRANKATGFNQA